MTTWNTLYLELLNHPWLIGNDECYFPQVSDRISDVVERNLGRQQDIDIEGRKRRGGRQESRILWQGDYDDREEDHEHEPYACVKVIDQHHYLCI